MAERPLGGGEEHRGYTGAYGGEVSRYGRMDRVRWGPILAGVFVTLSVSAVLGLLGLAVGALVYDPQATQQEGFGWGFTIWGIIVLIVSFGAGGWIAARSAAVRGEQSGLLNGGMVWAVAVPVMFWVLTGTFGTIMGPAAMMAQAVPDQQAGQVFGIPSEPQPGQEQAQPPQDPQQMEEQAKETVNYAAWGTLIGLLLALGAATGGGYLAGHGEHDRPDDRGRGRTRTTTTPPDPYTEP